MGTGKSRGLKGVTAYQKRALKGNLECVKFQPETTEGEEKKKLGSVERR